MSPTGSTTRGVFKADLQDVLKTFEIIVRVSFMVSFQKYNRAKEVLPKLLLQIQNGKRGNNIPNIKNSLSHSRVK
jgi:hypothetical protein